MTRGALRIYLGAAPGVGKTFAMLDEGARRASRGADVVVGFVETHGRVKTKAQIGELPIVRRLSTPYKGSAFDEMDVDAILARRPKVVLVDELQHTNNPTMRNAKRWQDVEELLTAGIDVITTLNVQHLESLNDVVERITGIKEHDTVPDSFVRQADQVELVDMSPEALRKRMAHGNIYPAEKVDAALKSYFRPGNLSALRELALLWLADRVEDTLQDYLSDHGMTSAWETRERVVVALTGAPGGENLVRRAARIAGRVHGDLIGVHVASSDGLSKHTGDGLERQTALLIELGGTYREIVGDDVATALASFATAEKATQVVLGATRRSRVSEMMHGSLVAELQRHLEGVDVHIISGPPVEQTTTEDVPAPEVRQVKPASTQRPLVSPLPRRELAAWAATVVGLPLLNVVLVALRDEHLNLGSALLANLAFVFGIAIWGGLRPGVFSGLGAAAIATYYFAPPIHEWSIDDADNVVSVGTFATVAVAVSALVDHAARRSREARRARADATALARCSGSMIGSSDPLPDLVDQLRAVFEQDSVSLLERNDAGWQINTSSGPNPPTQPADGTAMALDQAGSMQLVLRGKSIAGDDRQVLRAFADQMALGLEARESRRAAQASKSLSEANALRAALLQSVSRDLRSPVASIKADVTDLLSQAESLAGEELTGALRRIDADADRLDRVIGNLIDISRLHAGAVRPNLVPVDLRGVVEGSLATVGAPPGRVEVALDPDLPHVFTDPALLGQALANLVQNALTWGGSDQPVRIEAAELADRVAVRVIDHGPGIPAEHRDRLMQPFERLGTTPAPTGAGLGLAIAKGFVEVTGGAIDVHSTVGGGTTITIAVLVAADPEAAGAATDQATGALAGSSEG